MHLVVKFSGMEVPERQGPSDKEVTDTLEKAHRPLEDFHVNASANAAEILLVFGALGRVSKTKKVDVMPRRQIPQFVKGTNPLSFVRGIW